VLRAAEAPPERLSLVAGVAAASALDCLAQNCPSWGLRWPNDVVEPVPRPGGGRKVGGVLIEVRDALALVGIGINVGQEFDDFPPELRGKAVSLRMLGADASRIRVADALLRSLHHALAADPGPLAAAWMERDVLGGSTQTFIHKGKRIRGVVESIDPAHEIIVRTGDLKLRLPALTTSLVGES
jgi:BirA family biotin operon repressor/biotin-[acetyl-CoA-carboxylase] ligase